jgi:glycosyltransferase involved in cell wall biosynthesis
VVVISEGLGADWLAEQQSRGRLSNLALLPYQPYEQLSFSLASADVLVAILEAEAGGFSVPSKVLSYLSAGRPVLAAIPAENLAARLLKRAEAGIVVDPGDSGGMLDSAEKLMNDVAMRQSMACNGLKYARANFAIGPIADRFEAVLRNSRSAAP